MLERRSRVQAQSLVSLLLLPFPSKECSPAPFHYKFTSSQTRTAIFFIHVHRLSVYRSCDVRVGRSVQCVSMANYSLHKLILKLIPQDKRPSMQCSPNTILFQLSVFVPLSLPPVALPTSPAFLSTPQQTPVRGESVRSTACVLHVWVQTSAHV